MSWKTKAVALYKRFGAPVKFAAKLILGSFLPGGSAVVELVSSALDCVHETVKDNLEVDDSKMPDATAADLGRLEVVLDVLAGDLGALTLKIAALQGLPDQAARKSSTPPWRRTTTARPPCTNWTPWLGLETALASRMRIRCAG